MVALVHEGELKGAVHKGKFIKMVVRKGLKADDLVSQKGCVDKDVPHFPKDSLSVEQLQKLLEKNEAVFIKDGDHWLLAQEHHLLPVLNL